MSLRIAGCCTVPLLAALLSACGPTALPEAEASGSASAELKNCPPSHPDYPCSPQDPPPEPNDCNGLVASLSASPQQIKQGQSSTLYWSVQAPASCTGEVTLSSKPVPLDGSMTVTPLADQPYQLRLGTKIIATTTVKVELPMTVRINGNTPEWRRLLLQALSSPGRRVVLGSTVDMDMTGFSNIPIVQGVTLTSEAPPPILTPINLRLPPGIFQGPPERNARNLGPRIYTTDRPEPLFKIRCNNAEFSGDNVRLIGFRLQGPHFDTMEGNENLERGVMIDSCVGVEIADMELSGWSGQAVYIIDPAMRQFNPDAVKIHDNFFHHNQHEGGNGYGVDVSDGAYAAIERNVFDFNRHAIAASGAAGTGYRADHNLVLKGGGVHAKWYNEYTHLFDVHGDANCPDIPGNQHTWNCGNAGDQFWYTSNAFQYTNDHAIKLRGVPRVGAYISSNVFAHDDLDGAVKTKGDTRITVGPNTLGADSFGQYGVCDFDGDGRDDLFLATGASWWFSSGGNMHWTYLNDATERLNQVGLGDFDGDKRCDVFALNGNTWQISSGGSGAWTALPGTYSIPMEELRFGDFNGDHITDVFRRAPDGQWWATSPGRYGWTALQSSSIPLSDLRLGDFNGDGVTDVMGRSGGKWAVSVSGTSSWQPWNATLSDDLKPLLIGDVDGIAGDDVLRYVVTGPTSARWDISSGGRSAWKTLGTLNWAGSTTGTLPPVASVRAFVGRFDPWANADLLVVDFTRRGKLLSVGHSDFGPYGLYAY